jgi:hypothetical protein
VSTIRVISLVLAVLLGIAVSGLRTAQATEGFQPVSPDELKMTSEPKAPGAPAVVLFRQVDRDDNGRTSHEYNYLRIKILTDEGRKYGDVEIPFFKERGNNLVAIKARTIEPDGTIINFDGKVFEKPIFKGQGLKFMAKTFTLPEVHVGSVIEYFYTLDFGENLLFDSHWILSDELFTKHAKFSLKPYRSDYNQYTVRWSWHELPAGTVSPAQGPDGIVRLESSNIPAFLTEDFMPPENEMKSRVDFVYSEDTFEPDAEKYWKKQGKKLNDKLETFVGKRKAMEQAVSQIVSPSDSPEVQLQKIYARVQQVRNTSYEVQKTEQEQKREKEKSAANVEELWKAGYGNGQQITWLFLAMARAAGFEAYGLWAADRNNYFFNPKSLDSSKLDANVVLVKLNGKDIYCDPGAAFTPFGLLQWPETGVAGLRLDKDGGSWLITKLPESSESRIERKADLKLSDAGDLEGKLTLTFTGLEALWWRVQERNQDQAERKKALEEQVKAYVPAAIEVDLTNKPDWSSSAPTLIAEFELKIPGWVSGAGRRALVSVGIFSGTEKHLFDHANRVQPIYFQYPFQKVDDVSIQLPLGWQVSSLPAPLSQDGHIVHYALSVENDKGTLHLKRTLNVDILQLEAKYYTALRNFFQTVRTGDETQIVLQPGASAASN